MARTKKEEGAKIKRERRRRKRKQRREKEKSRRPHFATTYCCVQMMSGALLSDLPSPFF